MTDRQRDLIVLECLYMRDVMGMTAGMIAERVGKSRNAVLGIMHRVNVDMEDDNGVGDGTMPERWWE